MTTTPLSVAASAIMNGVCLPFITNVDKHTDIHYVSGEKVPKLVNEARFKK
jgi:hypothetical protein